jgi:malic enzyme
LADGDAASARITAEEALALHASGRPGKLETRISKKLTTARDLSLAYSPGVAEPCLRIARDPATAYDYTVRQGKSWWGVPPPPRPPSFCRVDACRVIRPRRPAIPHCIQPVR